MKNKLEEFLSLLYSQVDKGIYVWGANGEIVDDMTNPHEWIERRESNATKAKQAYKLYKERLNAGLTKIRAFDCSGLVYWALKSIGLQDYDVSSRGLYNLCDKIEKGELRAGDLVFHHNGLKIVHVGVYVGNGKVIEDKGYQYGVVSTQRAAGYWNRFGRWKAFEDEPLPEPTMVYVKGGSVNVRDKDNKNGKIVGVAHRGESYPLLGTAESGWHRIEFKGLSAYISNRADLTEVR